MIDSHLPYVADSSSDIDLFENYWKCVLYVKRLTDKHYAFGTEHLRNRNSLVGYVYNTDQL
jgi:hypothetical protein